MYEDEEEPEVAPLVYVRVLSSNPVLLHRSGFNMPKDETVLARDSGDVLINHDDALQLTPDITLLFRFLDEFQAVPGALNSTVQAEVQHFAKQYLVMDRVLGSGGNASVFVAVKQSTQKQVACKIVPVPGAAVTPAAQRVPAAKAQDQEAFRRKKREDLKREYGVLKDLDHPNIIRLEKVFCASHNIYIFQELITGGDLMSYINQHRALSEPQTATIIRQIVKAVEYLHDKQIVHRDIKPENVLLTSWREGARIVLTDFGQARTLHNNQSAAGSSGAFRMYSLVGTIGYTAP
jgi:hypothetical protein